MVRSSTRTPNIQQAGRDFSKIKRDEFRRIPKFTSKQVENLYTQRMKMGKTSFSLIGKTSSYLPEKTKKLLKDKGLLKSGSISREKLTANIKKIQSMAKKGEIELPSAGKTWAPTIVEQEKIEILKGITPGGPTKEELDRQARITLGQQRIRQMEQVRQIELEKKMEKTGAKRTVANKEHVVSITEAMEKQKSEQSKEPPAKSSQAVPLAGSSFGRAGQIVQSDEGFLGTSPISSPSENQVVDDSSKKTASEKTSSQDDSSDENDNPPAEAKDMEIG